MKIAIVCDWLVTPGGAEKVLRELLHVFPEADLFAVVDFVPPHQRDFLCEKPVKTTLIQHLPFAKTRYRGYLPLMPWAIERLDLSAYDLILSSSHAVAKGVAKHPHQVHISYVHTPMRYAWDLKEAYLKESGLDRYTLKGCLARYFLNRLQRWDFETASRVDHFIANSNYIAKRIDRAYQRKADVIYPPVDTTNILPVREKASFYLTASRLVPYKRVDLIVDAFNQMPDKKLVVIGGGPQLKKIKAIAAKNIEILGEVPHSTLIQYLQKARAFVFAADEDFGITPVEAQAAGTPVIAYGKGGALETVRGLDHPHPTGLFFEEQTTEALIKAVHAFEIHAPRLTAQNCSESARRFSAERFQKEILQFVEKQTGHQDP